MRVLTHFGLAALLVIAPALCCCNVRLLAGQLAAFPAGLPSCPTCPLPAPQPDPALPSCCHAAKPVKQASCCHETERPADTKTDAPAKPAPPKPGRCDLCGERPDAIPPEAAPSVADPEPTGELLPAASLGLAAVAPEHLGLLGGLDPPERAGVDARSAALFDRHVLRC